MMNKIFKWRREMWQKPDPVQILYVELFSSYKFIHDKNVFSHKNFCHEGNQTNDNLIIFQLKFDGSSK